MESLTKSWEAKSKDFPNVGTMNAGMENTTKNLDSKSKHSSNTGIGNSSAAQDNSVKNWDFKPKNSNNIGVFIRKILLLQVAFQLKGVNKLMSCFWEAGADKFEKCV